MVARQTENRIDNDLLSALLKWRELLSHDQIKITDSSQQDIVEKEEREEDTHAKLLDNHVTKPLITIAK